MTQRSDDQHTANENHSNELLNKAERLKKRTSGSINISDNSPSKKFSLISFIKEKTQSWKKKESLFFKILSPLVALMIYFFNYFKIWFK